ARRAAAMSGSPASEPATDQKADDSAATIAGLNQRLAALEEEAKMAKAAPQPTAVDDAPLRRMVAATLLDISAQRGEPYAALLQTAKPLAPDPAALAPLETFASTGIPSARELGRQLIATMPKLMPDKAPATDSFADRFQARAERLVKIERTDAVAGPDRAAIVSRLTADGQAGDLDAALKELKALAPADRAPVQSWIDKAEARGKALAAAHSFATAALGALQKTSR
ncbi:hypothetical protein, partial [Rhodopseudomonas sp. B29]|uniref:COG4223 family protein n=1 Tax=Rhodopseudomonas sp. B29 TaxID=95607 RepID=UPI0004CE3332